jgi:hypothetical protein
MQTFAFNLKSMLDLTAMNALVVLEISVCNANI